MLERLTVRKGGLVFYTKDGHLIPPINMSSFDVHKAITRLAEYEDEAELKIVERGGYVQLELFEEECL